MIEATELVDCDPQSPFCPPSWRWRRAGGIRLGLLRDTARRRDPWVGRALKFLIDRAAGRGDASGPELAWPDPAVLGAFRVWSSGDHRRRMELEARVLARQTTGEIAARLVLTADVVVAYERLYFDVRGRLGDSDYVMAVVIRHTLHDGFAAGDIDAVMKVFAFGYGPVVLDAVIEVLGVGDAAGGSPAVAVDRDLARAVRMAIATRSIPVTERTAPILVRLNLLSLEVERRAAARRRAWSMSTSRMASAAAANRKLRSAARSKTPSPRRWITASWTTAVGGRVWSGRSRRISREATRRSSS
jgi:hypothetical protein